MTKALS